jgi:hypothetical protein
MRLHGCMGKLGWGGVDCSLGFASWVLLEQLVFRVRARR